MSADTIVPGTTNPQNLNRYSYVSNNPLRYIDPTGNALAENAYGGGCSTSGYCPNAPYSPPPPPVNYCDTHPNQCGGTGNNGGSSSTTTPVYGTPPPFSTDITLGLSLGSGSGGQDYYGDYQNNTNVPNFPGANMQPNPCSGGGAAGVVCFMSLAVSLWTPAGGTNSNNNFFLSFTLTIGENGISTSDVQWSNQYNGPAVFSDCMSSEHLGQRGEFAKV